MDAHTSSSSSLLLYVVASARFHSLFTLVRLESNNADSSARQPVPSFPRYHESGSFGETATEAGESSHDTDLLALFLSFSEPPERK